MGHVVHAYKATRMREPAQVSLSKQREDESGSGSGRTASGTTRTVSPPKRARPADTESDTGKQKYSKGMSVFNTPFLAGILDQKRKEFLAASLTLNSWRRHFSALKQFEQFLGKTLDENHVMDRTCLENFAVFCLQKKLKVDTIKAYIGGLKLWCELKGKETDSFDSKILKRILDGGKNLELYDIPKNPARKVFTLPLLKLMGHEIALSDWGKLDKQVIWAAIVVAFYGSTRLGEILCEKPDSFSAQESLLWNDVKFREDGSVIIRLKITKSKTPQGEYVDFFRLPNAKPCPVKCLEKLKSLRPDLNEFSPVFRCSDGSYLTSKKLTEIIRKFLTPHLGSIAAEYSGHSLRAAIPSAIAEYPDLATTEDILSWGRWSSMAYSRYTRLKANKKKSIFSRIVEVINKQ